ncbi:protein kinase domain-containing protein [Novipirellula sp. SH528]|uniref:protein kinase domain-containing protein n=1 Tax=Novipirellula sp. SH528 TaxID=3454466 RepID=UPI003FA02CF5
MPVKDCPNNDTLGRYVLGQLTPENSELVESHLEACEACGALADTLSPMDELTQAFADSDRGPDEHADVVDDLIQRIQADHANANSETNDGSETTDGTGIGTGIGQGDTQFATLLRDAESPAELGRLGGYRVLEVLGTGGMGMVFRAEDIELRRMVALKVIKPSAVHHTDAADRFLREAQAAAAIEHENIVAIYQVGRDRDVPFIAMPLLKGESMEETLVREGAMDELRAVRIGHQIAEGLSAAHRSNLIHRDIKPDNLWLVDGDARVKILDFGLAREIERDAGFTRTGVVVGTPRYMAPEQALGEEVDHRSDLFSLGSVLYRMVSGKTPFRGKNVTSVLMAVAKAEPKPIQQRTPGMDSEFADLIMHLLSKDPEARPQSAQDVADRLALIEYRLTTKSAATESVETSAATSPATSVAPPWIRTGIAAGALVGLLFFGFLWANGVLFKVETSNGTLVIKTTGEDFSTRFKQGAFTVENTKTGKQVNVQYDESKPSLLPEGEYRFVLNSSDGLKTETNRFVIRNGETQTVEVWWEAPSNVVNSGNPRASAGAGELELTPEQREKIAMWKSLKPKLRAKAVEAELKSHFKFGGSVEFNDDISTVKIVAPGFRHIWPLMAMDTLRTIDVAKASVTDFGAIQKLPLESIQVSTAVYNPLADAQLKFIKTLKTINAQPALEYLSNRAALRTEIDEFAAAAKSLPTEPVVDWVNQMLTRLNPGSPVRLVTQGVSSQDLIGYVKQEGGYFVHARFCGGLRDLSPLRVLPFSRLDVSGEDELFDLSPLKGLPLRSVSLRSMVADLAPIAQPELESLSLFSCAVDDLSPLRGISIRECHVWSNPVSDIEPIAQESLRKLSIAGCPVENLDALRGLELESLNVNETPIRDISVLKGMPLEVLGIQLGGHASDQYRWNNWGPVPNPLTDLEPLRGMPLKSLTLDYAPEHEMVVRFLGPKLTINGHSADRFFIDQRKLRDATPIKSLPESMRAQRGLMISTPAETKEFLDSAEKLPTQFRVNAVVAKIAELANHGVEVTRSAKLAIELTPKGPQPTQCIIDAWSVHQIWPLQVIKSLQSLDIRGSSVTDFTPLRELQLKQLDAEVVLYNIAADKVFAEIDSLETINGIPKDEFLVQRASMRREFDEFAKVASSLSSAEIFSWIAPRLAKLNPDYEMGGFTAQGIQPGDQRISFENGLLKIWSGSKLRDLSPFRVLPMTKLSITAFNNIGGPSLYDLSPLKGLAIESLSIGGNPLADLRPIAELPLRELSLSLVAVSDLSPLEKMPLETINVRNTFVEDYGPLKKIKTLKTINDKPAEEFLAEQG